MVPAPYKLGNVCYSTENKAYIGLFHLSQNWRVVEENQITVLGARDNSKR